MIRSVTCTFDSLAPRYREDRSQEGRYGQHCLFARSSADLGSNLRSLGSKLQTFCSWELISQRAHPPKFGSKLVEKQKWVTIATDCEARFLLYIIDFILKNGATGED
jgi:hypothetical protein